jgi:hypothetical protein
MNKQLFLEPEQYLLGRWHEVGRLEKSADSIRSKYNQTFQRVFEKVRAAHRQLDSDRNSVQRSGEAFIGRKIWPQVASWPPGFWIEKMNLENLVSEATGEEPWAAVWMQPPKEMSQDEAVAHLEKAAQAVLTKKEIQGVQPHKEGGSVALWYYLPQSRTQLMQLLLRDQAQDFVECMTQHFNRLARFTPILDRMYGVSSSTQR